MALVTVTRSEPVTVTWNQGLLHIVGATLDLQVALNAAQLDRMNDGHEGMGNADVTVTNWDDGVP